MNIRKGRKYVWTKKYNFASVWELPGAGLFLEGVGAGADKRNL